MYSNIGKYERTLRIVLGLAMMILGWISALTGMVLWIIYFFGIILIVTGVVGWCGLYSVLGFSSRGEGLDRITKRDIERAVKEHAVPTSSDVETVKATKTSKKKVTKKKVPAKKKTTASKKSTSKKTSSKKAAPKKKASTKKKATTKSKK